MPLPDPKEFDTEDDYIGACMSAQKGEDKPQDQKLAICFSKWERRNKKESTMKKYDERNTDFSDLIQVARTVTEAKDDPDIKKIIKSAGGDYSGSNEDQGKLLELLKGLAFSDAPLANQFMKKLDMATTEISKELLAKKDLDEEVAGWIAMYNGKKLEIKKGKDADNMLQAKEYAIKELKVPKSKQGLLAIKPAS